MKDQLLLVLQNELQSLEKLLNILEKQHEYLVLRDVFKLDAVISEIELATREVAICESKRRSLVGKESMKSIVEKIGDKEIDEVYLKVGRVFNSLTLQKNTNELLVKQSLSYTNSMLAMMGPKKETPVYNGYGQMRR